MALRAEPAADAPRPPQRAPWQQRQKTRRRAPETTDVCSGHRHVSGWPPCAGTAAAGWRPNWTDPRPRCAAGSGARLDALSSSVSRRSSWPPRWTACSTRRVRPAARSVTRYKLWAPPWPPRSAGSDRSRRHGRWPSSSPPGYSAHGREPAAPDQLGRLTAESLPCRRRHDDQQPTDARRRSRSSSPCRSTCPDYGCTTKSRSWSAKRRSISGGLDGPRPGRSSACEESGPYEASPREEAIDGIDDAGGGVVDVARPGGAAEADPKGGSRVGGGEADGGEYV
jgi:hypothetical protein